VGRSRWSRGFFLAALLGAPGVAGAASLTGSLPASATAARLLFLDCANDGAGAPLSATVQVRDLAPAAAPLVSVQLRKGAAATNSTDDVDGDGAASPLVFVNGGSGRYDVYVDKTAAGEEAFEVVAQCWTGVGGSGAPTGTSLFSAQGGAVPLASLFGRFALGAGLLFAGQRGLRRSGARRAH
jgi:hypothetical protein